MLFVLCNKRPDIREQSDPQARKGILANEEHIYGRSGAGRGEKNSRMPTQKSPQTGRIQNWPGQGPLRLMFQDEARFGRITGTRRAQGPRLMVTREYTGACAAARKRDGDCMQLFLDEVASRRPHCRGAGRRQGREPVRPANLHPPKLPPPPNSIRLNIYAMSCAIKLSPASFSLVPMRLQGISNSLCAKWKMTSRASDPSPLGHGLLLRL